MNVNLATIDYLQEQNIRIAIVSQTGISVKTFKSYQAWEEQAKQMGIATSVDVIQDDTNAKNIITSNFLRTPGPTHMLLVDGSKEFLPWHVLALLSAKKHIITSNSPYHDNGMIEESEIEEISRVESGFIMISRESLIHLQDHEEIVQLGEDPFLKTYFNDMVRDGGYRDEHWAFGTRWQDITGRLWQHKLIRLGSS